MVGTLCNYVEPGIAQTIKEICLFNAAGNFNRAGIGRFAVGGKRFRLGGHVQKLAEHTVRIPHRFRGSGNVHKRYAGLFLQTVQILNDGILRFTNINHHLRAACQQCFKVQLTLATVKLAKLGKVIIFFADILLRAFIPCRGHASKLVGRKGKYGDLRERAGNGNFLDVFRQLYLTADRVRKHKGRTFNNGGFRRRGFLRGGHSGRCGRFNRLHGHTARKRRQNHQKR